MADTRGTSMEQQLAGEHRIRGGLGEGNPDGSVTVVLGAHDAADTIGATLNSLRSQTFVDWEAIVVDAGSRDATAEIVECYAQLDARIRLVRRPQAGVSAARNTGLAAAHGTWVVFLDAGDWLTPPALERLREAVLADPALDAACCGWARVTPCGAMIPERPASLGEESFSTLGRSCPLALHSCLVRRAIVLAVGGFDPSLATGEGWDLWQRVARAGARFGLVPGSLVRQRMKPATASLDPRQVLSDARRILALTHGVDPRVLSPDPRFATGLPVEDLPAARLAQLPWAAGLAIGTGKTASELVEMFPDDRSPLLDPEIMASDLLKSVLLPSCLPLDAWPGLWPVVQSRIDQFLLALERQSLAPFLARRTRRALEAGIVDAIATPRPVRIGTTAAVELEITATIPDLAVAPAVERLRCRVALDGERLGVVTLAVCDGTIPSDVLADAIAAEFAWTILGKFFGGTIIHELEARSDEAGGSLWRGDLCLAQGLAAGAEAWSPGLHEQIGWTLLLQEVWGRPTWTASAFYDPEHADSPEPAVSPTEGWLSIEVGSSLPSLPPGASPCMIELTVGGVAIGAIALSPGEKGMSAQALRVALTQAAGFELCRCAVREGLLGQPLTGRGTLRDRLTRAAAVRTGMMPTANPGGAYAPSAAGAQARAFPIGEAGLIFARRSARPDERWGRRSVLPLGAVPDLMAAARAGGEGFLPAPGGLGPIRRVIHAPDVVPRASLPVVREAPPGADNASTEGHDMAPAETSRLPILLYHRVAEQGSARTRRWRVTPDAFEAQLDCLRGLGYRGVTLEEWGEAMVCRRPLPGRAILLTFDDGYYDFAVHAAPLLRRYGFPAVVFLVAECVGTTNRWDAVWGEEVPLMGWEAIRRLQSEGIEFGSHSLTHPPLTALSPEEVVREASRSRSMLTRELGRSVNAFAYPYGDADPAVERLVAATGYAYGVTTRPGRCRLTDRVTSLPRIEISGEGGLPEFIATLGVEAEATA